ncbi:hypothetical protein D3C72_1252450 [compost metagenome]
MVRQNIVGDFPQPDVAFHHLFGIDIFHLDINLITAFFAFVGANILHCKTQHVLVTDSIDNHVFVQAFFKQHFGGLFDAIGDIDVIGENRRAGESKQLGIFKEIHNCFMGVAKLAAVAFIKNKHDALFAQMFELVLKIRRYSII